VWLTQEQLSFYKPVQWWQLCHDIDLLRGVYKYGFGNYQMIKENQRMSWVEMNDKVWPPPEKITKRLKNLLQNILSDSSAEKK
jgi:hypothetical protein